jgi:hypothetical protein
MYVQSINIVHVGSVTVINAGVTNVRYVNQGVVGAVTVVPNDAFIHARPVAAVAVVVPREEIMRAQVVGSTALVAPIRESVVVRGGAAVHGPPARFEARQVVVRTTPPPPPVAFAAKEEALRANGGRPLAPAQVAGIRQAAPSPRAPMVRTVNPQGPTFGTRPATQNQAPPVRNDRPSLARPVQQPVQPQSQPAVTHPETRTETPARTTEETNEKKAPAKKAAKKGDRTDKKGNER